MQKAKSDREHYQALDETKENLAKLRIAEAAERELRRRVAMEKKKQEAKQLAKIRSGGAGAGDDVVVGSSQDVNGATASPPAKPETARERFMREEAERKAAKRDAKGSAVPREKSSKKSMDFEESMDEESDDYDDDEDEDDDDDGFIARDDEDEEQQQSIWEIMNPGKDRAK